MPIGDYTSGNNEDLNLNYPVNNANETVFPATNNITKDTPIDSLGERYRKIVEFDLGSEEAYDELTTEYVDAWETYYGTGPAPAYSYENALAFKDALAFYLYITEDESYNANTFEDSIDFAPYIREEGSSIGTYENPDAYYDHEVYDRVTNGGADTPPRVEMNGDKLISASTSDKPQYQDMYSTGYLNSTEYEAVRRGPRTAYEWGSAYAVGKNTY